MFKYSINNNFHFNFINDVTKSLNFIWKLMPVKIQQWITLWWCKQKLPTFPLNYFHILKIFVRDLTGNTIQSHFWVFHCSIWVVAQHKFWKSSPVYSESWLPYSCYIVVFYWKINRLSWSLYRSRILCGKAVLLRKLFFKFSKLNLKWV